MSLTLLEGIVSIKECIKFERPDDSPYFNERVLLFLVDEGYDKIFDQKGERIESFRRYVKNRHNNIIRIVITGYEIIIFPMNREEFSFVFDKCGSFKEAYNRMCEYVKDHK
jgi:hypothetical protein